MDDCDSGDYQSHSNDGRCIGDFPKSDDSDERHKDDTDPDQIA
jgi:hypothetical protein